MKSSNDALWVIVGHLIKSACFIPINCRSEIQQLARAYIKYILRLHSVPRIIVFDRDTTLSVTLLNDIQ